MTMKIKCNKIPNIKAGEIVTVPAKNGVPTDSFWRKRLRDAKKDGCCEVVNSTKKATASNKNVEPVSKTPEKTESED